MSYGLIYKLRVGSLKYANDVVVEILKDGYSGTSYDKYLGSGGISLSKEDGGVVNGTSLKFAIQADSNLEYLNFFELPTRTFQVQLKVNNVAIWIGYIIAEEYSEQFIDPPYDVQVHAVDGLGLLKTEPYVIESSASARVSRLQVIQKILDTIGLTMPIVISYDVEVTSNSANIFTGALFADDYYEGWNCYEVLEKMIPPDATITQHEANWYIRRNGRDSEKTHTKYTWTGSAYVVTSVNGETALSLAPKGTGLVYPVGSSAEMQVEKAWRSLNLRSEHGKRSSWLKNSDFKNGLTNWTETDGVAGTSETYLNNGISYILLKHYVGGAVVSTGSVWQTVPFPNIIPFAINFSYSAIGYLNVAEGFNCKAQLRLSITDGVDTYYYNKIDKWNTDPVNVADLVMTAEPDYFEFKTISLPVYQPPISGTLKIELLRPDPGIYYDEVTVLSGLFTNIKIDVQVEEYNAAIEYVLPIRSNATEIGEVVLLPTDGDNVPNFDNLFYNVHQTGGAIITSFTDGAVSSNWVNLMINNLVFLHGVSRQIISGRFRGAGLTLNSVIICPSTTNRKYFIKSGTWNLYDDSVECTFVEIPGTATGSSWAVGATDWASYGEQSNQQTTPQGGGTTSTVTLPGFSGGGTSWLEQYFQIINPGTTDEFLRCIKTIASEGDMVAYSQDETPASLWDAMPIGSATIFGAIKVDGTTIVAVNGVITAVGGGSGVSDHGALTGLSDDDHPQYYNQARGDARYQPLDDDLTAIAALTGSNGVPNKNNGVWELKDETYVTTQVLNDALVTYVAIINMKQPLDADLTAIAGITETVGYLKKTAANTWILDNSTFLTAITKSMVEAVLTGAITSHTHAYEGSISKSTGYLTWNGTAWAWKNETYSLSSHNHDTLYEPKITKFTGYLRWTGSTWEFKNETYLTAITKALVEAVLTGTITSHNHSGVYEPAITKSLGLLYWDGTAWAFDTNSYALSSHNHDSLYEPKLIKSTGYLRWTGSTWEFKNETYLKAITKALVEAVLIGTITSHNHSGVYEPAITKSLGLLYWNGTAWAFDDNSYALASHNHSGVYQPIDGDLTAIAGQTGTGFLKRTATNTWGMAANGANLESINQDLATDDDVHFNSVDVEDLEVGEIIDGILQTGYGANLLRYSSEFENALWTKSDCTATDNSVDSPFTGSTVKGCYMLVDSSNPIFQQAVGNTNTGNHTFSIWLRSSGGNTTVTLKIYSNTQSHAGISVTATTSWQRFSVTNTLSTAHTTKYVRVEWSTQDLDVWGAQLEIGSTAGRYTHTESQVGGGSGAHIYDNLRVAGNLFASNIRAEGDIVATGEVTAYSDARLKHDITPTAPALDRIRQIEVVDYTMNGERQDRRRTGVIAQQILPLFPNMVEGCEMDYYSVNYPKMVSLAIKAIQELTDKVERLEQTLKKNGITLE